MQGELIEPRLGDWIQTASGRKFWPLDARPEDVCLTDIAHALSNLCRFTGHVSTFYSVAQHSVHVSEHVSPAAARLALLHDAAEAYMGDIARPWKNYLYYFDGDGVGARNYPVRHAESRLLDVILSALGVEQTPELWKEVHAADELLLVTEARDLMGPNVHHWHHSPANGYPILTAPILAESPYYARMKFTVRCVELGLIPSTI